jgi:hypothetical protein
MICDTGSVSTLFVTNPVSSSTNIWSTSDGLISGDNTGASINVTRPGTYYVTQYLQSGCSAYALDTLQVLPFAGCITLQTNLTGFSGTLDNFISKLKWTVQENNYVTSFELERSYDGVHFFKLKKITPQPGINKAIYLCDDNIAGLSLGTIFYRLKVNQLSGIQKYSQVVVLTVNNKMTMGLSLIPNPAKDFLQVSAWSPVTTQATLRIYDAAGRQYRTKSARLQKGNNTIIVDDLQQYAPGVYLLTLQFIHENYQQRFVVAK